MTESRGLAVPPEGAGQRLDHFIATQLDGVSRSRVQLLLDQGDVLVNGAPAKPSLKLRGGEQILITGEPHPAPLKAKPQDIPLDVVFEDKHLAIINKPAGMMVHAGAGETEDARNSNTLVNALLFRFNALSSTGGDLRPGIVHRLDKETSGLIVVAKSDAAHAKLGELFSSRQIHKTYIALVHGWVERQKGTITAAVSRDPVRRTRMTTRRDDGRTAISHYRVLRRIESRFGRFTLVSVRIETGRTHQIRVHMASIGYPIVGDTLYGAPALIHLAPATGSAQTPRRKVAEPGSAAQPTLHLERNFLHAAELALAHPVTGKPLAFEAPLPEELELFLKQFATELTIQRLPAPAAARARRERIQ